jgi:DNA polymerase-3 subunit alpha
MVSHLLYLGYFMADTKFVHLHTHSHYSLLDGLSKVDDMVDIAVKQGMPAMAITDHGNMYGAIDFYKTCKAKDIKPIIGCEVYMTAGSRHDRAAEAGGGKRYYHLILLAKNLQGYKNLIRLVTIANLEGYYYKPRVDKEILRQYHDGIICLSGCMGGELSQTLLRGDTEKADELVAEYQDIFGKENYFIEIQRHPSVENDERCRNALIAVARKHGVDVVATQDSHYPCSDDHHAHHTLLQINTQGDGKEGAKFEFSDDDFSLISTEEALKVFKDIPEAVTNTMKVADMCNLELELGKWVFPDIGHVENETHDETLRRLSYEGIATHGLTESPDVISRLEYELGIIKNKGYAPYFLVVADLLRFAKESGILTTIRGSVAGSLTTYLTGITNVNPLEYQLPFERFLNPERPSAPDIDMDYADNRRDEMIEYAKKKYGEDKVAQIGTFGTMMARGAVRDVARALGYPYGIGDRISKLIPLGSQGFPMTIDHAMEMVPELAQAYKKEDDTKIIIDLAKKLEGCVRHISVHAAGVVIAPFPLYEYVPTQLDPKGGKIITQYDMHAVEDAGLLKFDFLGIRNLAILADAVKLVKRFHDIDIDLENLPLNDKKTFAMLAAGQTMGLFQLNGSGMTRYLKELRPTTIHDINAMVALYRPGPMEMIPEYIKRKHNPAFVKYDDPRMREYLEFSNGLLVYQDDVLLTSIKLGGYSWLDADKLRKAMGKKIPEVMEAEKEKLIKGFIEWGKLSKALAEKLWHLIEPFAAYGFGKAHAASYGKVAYQTAYMKANFPIEYMTAILTAESGDVEKIAEIINECEQMKIPVLPPNINESFGGFTVIRKSETNAQEQIRFGLYTVKNLGTDISDAIIAERKAGGRFTSISNFLNRIKHKNLNKKSLEALIKCGAMDEFGERGALLANSEDMLTYNKEINKGETQQTSLFGSTEQFGAFKLKDAPAAEPSEMLAWEKELLGLYISGHPLDKWKDILAKKDINIKRIKEEFGNGMAISLAVLIEEVKPIITKKNQQMAFLKVADLTDKIDAVVFPKLYKELQPVLVADKCITLQGTISLRNGEKSILIEKAKLI